MLDKMNLQNIIDNKNLAHAITAMDLLRMDGYEIIEEDFYPTDYELVASTPAETTKIEKKEFSTLEGQAQLTAT